MKSLVSSLKLASSGLRGKQSRGESCPVFQPHPFQRRQKSLLSSTVLSIFCGGGKGFSPEGYFASTVSSAVRFPAS
jgi:hypothetical protein